MNNNILYKDVKAKACWIDALRAAGFKAAHPNNGWIDHEKLELILAYPHFDDGVKIGDAVMLGWWWGVSKQKPVRIIGKRCGIISELEYFQFEYIRRETWIKSFGRLLLAMKTYMKSAIQAVFDH